MIHEVATINVRPGDEHDFTAAVAQARTVIEGAPGAGKVGLYRDLDASSRFTLVVEWESVAHHTRFRRTPGFASWREAVGGYFADPPHAVHLSRVL